MYVTEDLNGEEIVAKFHEKKLQKIKQSLYFKSRKKTINYI